jgi:hypothetical protein
MTPVEAVQLVKRIEGTWPDRFWTDARRTEWAGELETLDMGSAGTAFVRLKRSENQKHCPSIGEFISACRALHTPTNDPISHCICHGSGWIYSHFTSQDREGLMPNGQPIPPLVYEFVKPCPECSDGRRLVEPTNRIEIERERARTR